MTNNQAKFKQPTLVSRFKFNPFLTRFFALTSPIKTVFFDNSVTLKTVLICVYKTNWMCLTKTSVVQ